MWEMTEIFNLFHNKISPSGWNWWKLLVESHVCVHKRINAARHANGVYSRYMYTWQNAWSDERRYLMKFLTILWTNFLLEGCENLEGPVSHQRNMCFKAFYVCLSTLNLRRAGLEKCPFILLQLESGCGLLSSFPERTSSVIWFTSDRLRCYARSSQGYHIKQTVRSSDSSNTTLARFVVCWRHSGDRYTRRPNSRAAVVSCGSVTASWTHWTQMKSFLVQSV